MPQFFDPEGAVEKRLHNLPHWQQEDTWIFVTWRLADSLPKARLDAWKEERETWLAFHPEPWDEDIEREYHERFSDAIDKWLDAGHGSCLLRDPSNAHIVTEALHHFEGDRYELAGFVVMPNHVHVLFRPLGDHVLSDIIHSWKRHCSREINKLEGRSGSLWQADYWDRLIRSQKHFDWVIRYIERNPKNLLPDQFVLWP